MSNFDRVDTTANRIKEAMLRANKKQADIAREADIDKGALSSYLKGKYEPKQDVIYRIARVLDVSEMWLWGYDCPMERPVMQKEIEKKADSITEAVLKMKTDADFLSMVEGLVSLDADQRAVVKHLISTFLK